MLESQLGLLLGFTEISNDSEPRRKRVCESLHGAAGTGVSERVVDELGGKVFTFGVPPSWKQ